MKKKENNNLHVVQQEEDTAGKIVNEVITELHESDAEMQEMQEKIKRHRRNHRIRVTVIAAAIVLLVSVSYWYITYHTFTKTRIVQKYQEEQYHNSSYEVFADSVIKYSKDGISLLNKKGREKWNQSYQMATPVLVLREKTGVIADNGGNHMIVFQETGVKGEIQTNLPIEKIDVSEQGIVAAILKEELSPKVVCYDAEGNLLAEHKIAVSTSGYPVEVSISDDGKLLMVSYLKVENSQISTNVVYYNFGGKDSGVNNYEVFSKSYPNEIIPEGYFIGNETSVLVGSSSMMIFHGKDKPQPGETITVEKKIKSVFRHDKYVGMLLKNEGKEGYELRVYTIYGKQVFSENLTKEYSHVTMSGREILLYNNNQLCIYQLNGSKRFEGELSNSISKITPVSGINKYLVMNADGMEEIQFVK